MKTHFEQAEAWLRRQPPAISGDGGHKTTFRVAILLRVGFALSVDEVVSLMAVFNSSCDPRWNEKELRHKVDEAFKVQSNRMIGFMLAPERPQIRRIVATAACVRRIALSALPEPKPTNAEEASLPRKRDKTAPESAQVASKPLKPSATYTDQTNRDVFDTRIYGSVSTPLNRLTLKARSFKLEDCQTTPTKGNCPVCWQRGKAVPLSATHCPVCARTRRDCAAA